MAAVTTDKQNKETRNLLASNWRRNSAYRRSFGELSASDLGALKQIEKQGKLKGTDYGNTKPTSKDIDK